ncbi:hypothetical protein [Deinococcus cellulosilyticus]|uniref:Uncharacterized protein n=1 Tax=Deinococcus cellulosilyticus (strain DSM 18568 / NBRC 106333 / KACC 11606 / 5516J-15) TaxID=1223518 RepID=A0A511N8V6_DEIC1|nr:hypothetical protein [Deinococcus cellulosilyticus]GEM49260.1 hypothetical protein DC3_48950 [Deinococcus cellulosilyticus NBRC 106333 = KACC 11606]
MNQTQMESIRLETHWTTLKEGSYELPVYESEGSRILFFYETGIPSDPARQVHYGVRLQAPQGETLLMEKNVLTLEEALSDFERLHQHLQQQGQQVIASRSL